MKNDEIDRKAFELERVWAREEEPFLAQLAAVWFITFAGAVGLCMIALVF